jgi:hypothetical protein
VACSIQVNAINARGLIFLAPNQANRTHHVLGHFAPYRQSALAVYG